MEVMVPVRSVKGYIQEFAVDAIGKKHGDPEIVKEQIIDSFQKEIFNQLMLRFDDPALLAKDISKVDPETKRKVDNILTNSVRKWRRLCIEFPVPNLLFPSDLMVTLEDIVNAQTNDATLGGGSDE